MAVDKGFCLLLRNYRCFGIIVYKILLYVKNTQQHTDTYQFSKNVTLPLSFHVILHPIEQVVVVFDGYVSKADSIICLVMYLLYIVLMKFNAGLRVKVTGWSATRDQRHCPLEEPVQRLCDSTAMIM